MAEYKALANWKLTDAETRELFCDLPSNLELVCTGAIGNDELVPLMHDIHMFTGYPGIPTMAMLDNAPNLRLLVILGHGIDFLLDPAINKAVCDRGITVCKAQQAAVPIAEHIVMAMIALTKRTFKLHENYAYRADPSLNLWNDLLYKPRGELCGGTVGFLGFGAIAIEAAKRLRGFDMTLGALSRRPDRIDQNAHGVSFTANLDGIEAFLARCDYVVLTLPRTPETENVMNAQRFEAMKDGSFFINIARGQLVDDEALYHALRSGKLAGAAIDPWRINSRNNPGVYPTPYPIHHFNVIMTPKCSGTSFEKSARGMRFAIENFRRLAKGEPLLHVADPVAGY